MNISKTSKIAKVLKTLTTYLPTAEKEGHLIKTISIDSEGTLITLENGSVIHVNETSDLSFTAGKNFVTALLASFERADTVDVSTTSSTVTVGEYVLPLLSKLSTDISVRKEYHFVLSEEEFSKIVKSAKFSYGNYFFNAKTVDVAGIAILNSKVFHVVPSYEAYLLREMKDFKCIDSTFIDRSYLHSKHVFLMKEQLLRCLEGEGDVSFFLNKDANSVTMVTDSVTVIENISETFGTDAISSKIEEYPSFEWKKIDWLSNLNMKDVIKVLSSEGEQIVEISDKDVKINDITVSKISNNLGVFKFEAEALQAVIDEITPDSEVKAAVTNVDDVVKLIIKVDGTMYFFCSRND